MRFALCALRSRGQSRVFLISRNRGQSRVFLTSAAGSYRETRRAAHRKCAVSTRVRMPSVEIPASWPIANCSSVGDAAFFWLLFVAAAKKSDSGATARETLLLLRCRERHPAAMAARDACMAGARSMESRVRGNDGRGDGVVDGAASWSRVAGSPPSRGQRLARTRIGVEFPPARRAPAPAALERASAVSTHPCHPSA